MKKPIFVSSTEREHCNNEANDFAERLDPDEGVVSYGARASLAVLLCEERQAARAEVLALLKSRGEFRAQASVKKAFELP